MMRLISAGIVTLMTLGMIGGVALFVVIQHFGQDLPTLEKLKNYEPPTATRLYAGNGRLLTEYANQRRVYVPLTAIPKRVRQAFIAAEDKNFYYHPGVDFFGIARAMITNFKNIGTDSRLVGGSTITQQVVKNFLLTNEQSFERKIKEALLAFRINKVLKKDTVLELYLNEIYLGGGAYGVASAALHYFNKSLDELTLEEAAYLAALPKAPNNYNPVRHYDAAKARRDWVISRMEEDDYVTEAEATVAQAQPLTIRAGDETEFAVAAFFAEEVRRQLVEMYGSEVLYEGGLTVHTTVDPQLQRYARDALRKALIEYDHRHGYRGPEGRVAKGSWLEELQAWKKLNEVPLIDEQQLGVIISQQNDYARVGFDNGLDGKILLSGMAWARTTVAKTQDVVSVGDIVIVSPTEEKGNYVLEQVPAVNGAMMALDPHTGRVLAMVGGYSYENTEFNRATQAMRQPGSSFKPIVFLSALEAGFTPSTIIMDAPISISQGPGLPLWQPKNYGHDYLGPATLRKGLETSRNVMTVRLALQVGIERIVNTALRLGFYKELDPYFSIVLGAKETTLDRVVNSYGILVNGGKRIKPSLIERIQNRKGETIYRRDTRRCENCRTEVNGMGIISPVPPIPEDTREQLIDPKVAYQMVSLMEGVVQRGTAVRAKVLGRPLAGKTGTTNDSRDAWFVGYTPDLVAGVYVGFDKPKKLGNKETGGRVALPAFISFMENALKDTPSTPFRIPEGMRFVKLDSRTGQPPNMSTPSNNIIFEAFLPDQIPGSRPTLDVSTPVFDAPMGGSGYGGFGRESVNGVETDIMPDSAYDNGLITPNRYNNNGGSNGYSPVPNNQQQQPSNVTGTGGLY